MRLQRLRQRTHRLNARITGFPDHCLSLRAIELAIPYLIFSTVTAGEALKVAQQAAALLQPGQYFLDLNSVDQ
jgi:hypothetical protein